jgi:hypothetical protein
MTNMREERVLMTPIETREDSEINTTTSSVIV